MNIQYVHCQQQGGSVQMLLLSFKKRKMYVVSTHLKQLYAK